MKIPFVVEDEEVVKRAFDILLSTAALLVIGPLLPLLGLMVIVDSGWPMFYRGWRAGRHGKPFRILKLRTMVKGAEQRGGAETAADDPRITRAGVFLRRYKLDELPQFVNVLLGDMSLVGPRPEVLDEVERYDARQRGLLSVRPGITDWASIKFRHEAEILRGATDPKVVYHERIQPEKIRLGLKYVQERSLLVDLAILAHTVKAILKSAELDSQFDS